LIYPALSFYFSGKYINTMHNVPSPTNGTLSNHISPMRQKGPAWNYGWAASNAIYHWQVTEKKNSQPWLSATHMISWTLREWCNIHCTLQVDLLGVASAGTHKV